MNQYAQINAGHLIDGYFIPQPNETADAVFDRAKRECVFHLRQSVATVEQMTWETFRQLGFQKHYKPTKGVTA